MKIVVCVKQVPESTEVSVDSASGRPNWDSTTCAINPFDTYAIEQGVLLEEAHGGEVIALTMGPAKAEETLREALSSGSDRAVHLLDPAFDLSDSWATASILAHAVRKIGDVDLVICGKQAVDGDTAQVGPSLAAHLDWPQVTYVSQVRESGEEALTVLRMHDTGADLCEVKLPAVITVVKDINSPRIPSLRSRMAAKKAEIPVWTASDIGIDPATVGASGSPTRVVEARKPEARDKKTLLIEGESEECATRLVDELHARLR